MNFYKAAAGDGDDDNGASYAEVLAHVEASGNEMLKVVMFDDDEGGEIITLSKDGRTVRFEFTGEAPKGATTAKGKTMTTSLTKDQTAALVAKLQADNADKATAAFEKRVNEVKQRDKCNRQDAMRQARIEFPTEYEALQNA